jgi:hypothetical protein
MKTRKWLTLIFRKTVLFSLHHANASVHECRERASSIRRISVNSSMSTNVCRARRSLNQYGRCSKLNENNLDSLLIRDFFRRLLFSVPKCPIDKPPVQPCFRPPIKFRVVRMMHGLDGC